MASLILLTGIAGSLPDFMEKSNTKFARVTIATDETFKNPVGGVTETATQWHTVILSGRLANAAKKITKGTFVSIEGLLVYQSYVDANEIKRYVTQIHARKLTILNDKPMKDVGSNYTDTVWKRISDHNGGIIVDEFYKQICHASRAEDAQRIVECVNALRGVENPQEFVDKATILLNS